VKGEIVGFFNYCQNLRGEDLKSILLANGLTILFPYLRSTVSNISTMANVNSVTVPTMNIVEYMGKKFNK